MPDNASQTNINKGNYRLYCFLFITNLFICSLLGLLVAQFLIIQTSIKDLPTFLENGNTLFVPTGNNDGTFANLAGIGGKFYYEVKYAAGSDTIYAGYAPVDLANNEGTSNPITSFIGQYRNTGLQIGRAHV